MTSHEDLLAQSLDRQAAQAPRDDDLLDQVHARLKRRRSGRAAGALVLASAAVATGIFGVHSVLGAGPDPIPATQISPGPPRAEAGWRWESYRTIQLQVPDDWGFGTTDRPACVIKREPAYVGRMGFVPAIGCNPRLPEPAARSPYLWFASREPVGIQTTDGGWTKETREFDGVKVTVFTDDDALRRRIFASVRPIVSSDANGCSPVVPTEAPNPGDGLGSVGTVQSVSVCDYRGQILFASSELEDAQARAAVDAILAAPAGRGPDSKEKCTDVSPVGLLLKVDGSAQDAEVAIRYSGCAGNGASDGSTEHRLTKQYLQLLLSGPHELSGWSGDSGVGRTNYRPK